MVGPQAIVQMGRRLGIRSPLPAELSLALGACEVTPLDLACAYNSIASGGCNGCFSGPWSHLNQSQHAQLQWHKGGCRHVDVMIVLVMEMVMVMLMMTVVVVMVMIMRVTTIAEKKNTKRHDDDVD